MAVLCVECPQYSIRLEVQARAVTKNPVLDLINAKREVTVTLNFGPRPIKSKTKLTA